MRRVALTLLLAGCTASIPRPTALDAERTHVALASLETGRGLFLARCGNCHLTPDPKSQTSARWRELVPEMSKDAELSHAETADLLAFLEAFSSDAAHEDADGQRGQRQPQ